MIYRFSYFFDKHENEQEFSIEMDNEKEAVLNFLDKMTQKYGVEKMKNIQFACLKSDGTYFIDENKKEELNMILRGL